MVRLAAIARSAQLRNLVYHDKPQEWARLVGLSERVMEIGQKIGMTLLVALMVFVFYNDIARLVQRWLIR